MNCCIDIEIGRLLPMYEVGSLTEDQALMFEEHLLFCEFCLHELECNMSTNQLLLKHREQIVSHLSGESATERGDVTKTHFKDLEVKSRESRTNTLRSNVIKWYWPTFAVVAAAVLFILFRVDTSDFQETNSRVTEKSGSSEQQPPNNLGGETEPPPSQLVQLDSTAPRPQKEAIGQKEISGTETQTRKLSREIEALLPTVAIPFAAVLPRGEAQTGTSSPVFNGTDFVSFDEAMIVYAKGNYELSATLLDSLVQHQPTNAGAWMYLGSARYVLGDFAKAEKALLRAETFAGKDGNAKATFYRAAALVHLGRSQDAAEILKEITNDPNRAVADSASRLLALLTTERKSR